MFDRSPRNANSNATPAVARPAPTLTLGAQRDAAEVDADHAAATALSDAPRGTTRTVPRQKASQTSSDFSANEAPESVHKALRSDGQPLDGSVQTVMERKFDHRFSDVRVHDNAAAASSARDVEANAYTVGNRIAFAGGRYAPSTPGGQSLLAHELAHVVQNSGMSGPGVLRRQPAGTAQTDAPKTATTTGSPQPGTPATATATPAAVVPRQDYVFIMGADTKGTGNPFYKMAERFYRSHLSGATFVTSIRNFADLLSWISTNVKVAIGNVYIVSHANEDGTLSFALNGADKDTKLTVPELRDALHPAKGGASSLASVATQIDASTKIHIKGCDIGRTQEMVELLDEAFGGEGTVTAPTHEQVYGTDPTLEKAARAQFKAGVEASHPLPPPVDPALKGADKATATKDRNAVVKQRGADIKAELKSRKGEQDALAEEANTFEAFSGPMFQQPGTTLFKDSDIKPQVDTMYAHLSDKQRAALVKGLIAPDARSAAVANAQGTFSQHGQRVYKKTTLTYTLEEPATAAEANRVYREDFAANHFKATDAPVVTHTPASGGFTLSVTVPGQTAVKGGKAKNGTRTFSSKAVIPDDAALIAQGKAVVSNPARYAWRLTSSHSASTGVTTRSVIGERVLAYLHHGSLDASAHEHFDAPESDSKFFATSTFAPAPPPPAATAPTGTP
ncbi:MAG: DUF4157 domain-containing protein [Gemmatimonadaceae bacterium]